MEDGTDLSPSEQLTSDEGPEDLAARSTLVSLEQGGVELEGVSLQELDDEPRLEIRAGATKYQVLRAVGEGGMGKVYAVIDRDLKRPVALKMARVSGDRRMEQRFLEEAQVMGQLQHPNILAVHELGLTEKRNLYYTMPLVRGRTLRTVLDELKRSEAKTTKTWSLTRLVQLLQQVGQAVDYAHAKGVLHRDLKPENVMVGEHGEVQVLDWGLAKVVSDRSVETDLRSDRTATGRLVGTPAYMSPEQARGEEVDARADVYAVGVMLYEALTLARPFTGPTQALLQAVSRDQPPSPRVKAPGRNIPLELESICLKALRKQREARQQSLGELAAELQAWLEAESDKAKRHERAEEKAADGKALLAEYFRLKEEVQRLELEAKEVASSFEPWQSADEKREMYAAQDRARVAAERLVDTAASAVTTLERALGFEEENLAARTMLADYYWEQFSESERKGDRAGGRFNAQLVAEYHGGKYARELAGDGSLTLTSDPVGAEAWLHPLVERGPVLVDGEGRWLGATPLTSTAVAMGSYVVVLKKEGYREVRYPVQITRNRVWVGSVRMCTEDEAGVGFVLIPGGPCIVGGDDQAYGWVPRREIDLGDFFVARHPVTMGEYLEYVNDVARREGLEAARKRSPRSSPTASYLVEDGAGGLKLPEVDAQGDRWDARLPVAGVSWRDAIAYCEWRSARDGRAYRLPSEEEWEKSARGVDGRLFPWGWRFDASLCNMKESRKERPAPVCVDEFPTDLSVYGVRGLGGNVRDWTSTEDVQGTGESRRDNRVFRGGNWLSTIRFTRLGDRHSHETSIVFDGIGFRLARSRD